MRNIQACLNTIIAFSLATSPCFAQTPPADDTVVVEKSNGEIEHSLEGCKAFSEGKVQFNSLNITEKKIVSSLCNTNLLESKKMPTLTLTAENINAAIAKVGKTMAPQPAHQPEDNGLNAGFERKHGGRYDKMWTDTKVLLGVAIGGVGVIGMLPESISKWKKNDMNLERIGTKYTNNVMAGPVVDKDELAINYIGHPLWGSYTYILMREEGYTKTESLVFATLFSTFGWEYGAEAVAETPSIQDLISTPLVGALIGEVFYKGLQAVKARDGKLFNSRALGKTAMILLDPLGGLTRSANFNPNRPNKMTMTTTFVNDHFVPSVNPQGEPIMKKSTAPGIWIKLSIPKLFKK